jgi:large subunit ribosomal protein L19e|tara:strand:- start:129 stop:569 length:441 start_codon:yes stop_codon:yes gene_type:complete
MSFKTQKRLAASLLHVGKGRVWLDPDDAEAISGAVTRSDVRGLINSGAVQPKPVKGVSKYRARKLRIQRAKGRRSGQGKRSGTKGARYPKKRRWISTIRPVRRKLRELKDAGEINNIQYRKLYLMAKGGAFKNTAYVEAFVKNYKG